MKLKQERLLCSSKLFACPRSAQQLLAVRHKLCCWCCWVMPYLLWALGEEVQTIVDSIFQQTHVPGQSTGNYAWVEAKHFNVASLQPA